MTFSSVNTSELFYYATQQYFPLQNVHEHLTEFRGLITPALFLQFNYQLLTNINVMVIQYSALLENDESLLRVEIK